MPRFGLGQASEKTHRPKILFLRGRDPFSLSVQMMTLSEVSHVALILPSDRGELALHALVKGVRLEPRDKLDRNFDPVAEFVVLPDVRTGLAFLLKQVGKPYDEGEVASRLFYHGLQAIFPWIAGAGTSTPAKDKWTCGRLTMALDPVRNRIPEWWVLDPSLVTPVDLLDTTTKNSAGSFFRVS